MRKRWLLPLLTGVGIVALGSSAWAEFRIEKSLKLQPKGRFELDSDQGSVTVTGETAAGARVVITANRDDIQDLFDFDFEEGPGLARVTCRRRHWGGWTRNVSMHYEIEVPAETHTEIRTGGGSVKLFGLRDGSELKTSGGSVEVSGLGGNLDAHTSGGSMHLREVTGDARVDTSGGSIEAASIEGSLYARTSGGPIRVDRVTGYVDVRTSGGSVHVNFGPGNSRGGDVETSGGSIEVAVDPSANLDLDASTSGGSITSELRLSVVGTISSGNLHGSIGRGGETLRLHTSGGSIRIRAL
jgi:hypothetical protein